MARGSSGDSRRVASGAPPNGARPRAPTAATRLAATPLGRDLGRDGLRALIDGSPARRLRTGQTLVSQGAEADDVHVLVSGRLAVIVNGGGVEHVVAHLDPGALIGEIALLAGERRSATVRASEPSTCVAVSAARLRSVLAAHPEFAERLAKHASERLREARLVSELGVLFGPLPAAAFESLHQLLEWVTLPAGSELFAAGDPGDAAYLVVDGRVRVARPVSGGTRALVDLGRGSIVGETALLEDSPRTASVFAVRDSHLVRLRRAAYDTLTQDHPAVAVAIARTVLRRTHGAHDGVAIRPSSVVIVPAGDPAVADALAAELAEALGEGARCVSSADVDTAFGIPGISQVDDEDTGATLLSYWLDALDGRCPFIVFRIDGTWTPWSRRALRSADLVLVVADARDDPKLGPIEQELLGLLPPHRLPRLHLALVHEADVELPTGTRRWLDQRELAAHHHVRRDDPASVARLARLLGGRGTALVLGGGGARGFAHLGVLSTLEGVGTPVDLVAGCSIGAIMAGAVGLGWSAAHARQTAVREFRDLLDYTLPTASLLRGERITTKLRSVFGAIDIADLWVPYFCVSTNLTKAELHVHDRGDLVEAIRASIAIPGVLPPVAIGDQLFVDGGVLENVPVTEMRHRNPTGPIIAVDVAPLDGPVAKGDYGLHVRGLSAWRARRRGDAAPPSVLTTLMRSSLVASVRDRDRTVAAGVADLYLDLAVDGGGMLDFRAAADIAAAGEADARPVIDAWARGALDGPNAYVIAGSAATPSGPGPMAGTRPRSANHGWGGVLLLTARDVQHRAVRFGAVVTGAAVVFTLLFLMVGLVEQFRLEPRDTVRAFGADHWLVRAGSSGVFTSGATMPADTAALLAGVTATPVVVARHAIDTGSGAVDVVVVGLPLDGLGQPDLVDGRPAAASGELVVDRTADLAVGESTSLGGHPFVVTGVSRRTTLFAGMPLVYLELGTAQSLVYRGQPLASAVLLDRVPATVPVDFTVLDADTIADDAGRPLEHATRSVALIQGLLWLVAAMIIGTMLYLSALERRRDVAVLTAVGAGRRQLGASIAIQGALTGLAASLSAAVLQRFVVPVFPLTVVVPGRALVQIPALAVVVSLTAGLFGLRTALRTDPALAFGGPGS